MSARGPFRPKALGAAFCVKSVGAAEAGGAVQAFDTGHQPSKDQSQPPPLLTVVFGWWQRSTLAFGAKSLVLKFASINLQNEKRKIENQGKFQFNVQRLKCEIYSFANALD